MRGLLAYYLGKERQEDAYPRWQALDLFPVLSRSSFLVCLSVPIAHCPFYVLCPSVYRSPTCGKPGTEDLANEGKMSGLEGLGGRAPYAQERVLGLPVRMKFLCCENPLCAIPTRGLRQTPPHPPAPRPPGLKKEGRGIATTLRTWVWGFHLPPSSLAQVPL